jgi:hypothetical protein
MARGGTSHLSERLELIHATIFVSTQMQHDILQRARMAIAQHETIPIPPLRIRGAVIAPHPAEGGIRPEQVGHGGASHGSTGMSRVGLLDHVRGEGTDGVDAFELEGRSFVGRQLGHLVVRLLVQALRGGLVYHFVVLIPTSLESLVRC